MDIQDQISSAIAAHGKWKIRLKAAIENGASDLSPSKAQSDSDCVFGKWLQDSAATPLKTSLHHAKCVELHRQFHIVAARVLTLALSGKRAEAMHLMDLQGEFARASSALTHEMMAWKSDS